MEGKEEMKETLAGAIDIGVADTPVLTLCWGTSVPYTHSALGHLTLKGCPPLTGALMPPC